MSHTVNENYELSSYLKEIEDVLEDSPCDYSGEALEKIFLNAYSNVRDELDDLEYGSKTEHDFILKTLKSEIFEFNSIYLLTTPKNK